MLSNSIVPSVETSDQESTHPAERPTLLVVDDEEGPRQSLRVVFKEDYNLLLAEDGGTAIRLAREQKIDVAVLDIRMAGMSGIDVLERLKIVDPAIEVVMLTAFETSETLRQALRLQACDYITKPFEIGTIREAVTKAMRRRTLSSELRTNAEKLKQLQSDLETQRIQDEIVRARSDIYAAIIHDINGPLTIMSSLMQTMNQRMGELDALDGDDLDFVKDRLRRLARQVTNCIDISRRYLASLKPDSDGVAQVWINQILGDLRDLLRSHPGNQHNQVLICPLTEDVRVSAHATDLIQVLLNLTINALQCGNESQRVEIKGQILDHPLDLSQFQDGPEDLFVNQEVLDNRPPLLALAVQDNGPGIAASVLPHIFESYFSAGPRHHGTGLGLCIVQRLLRSARGACHVHSKCAQGTVFTVYMPAQAGKGRPGAKHWKSRSESWTGASDSIAESI